MLLASFGGVPILPPLPIGGSPAPPAGNGFPQVGAAVFLDDGGPPRAADLWGSVDCERPVRARDMRSGGDSAAGADGRPQEDAGYRRLRVVDGDNVSGERCELGQNDHRTSPVALYREGMRRITYVSLRLGDRFPIDRKAWQVVLQMKQSQPADAGGGVPVLSMQANRNRWRLLHNEGPGALWSAPATVGRWVRFAFDVTYSTSARTGSLRVSADLNGDGDATDEGERGERVELRTLKVEGPGDTEDGLAEGDPIPSHLRVGVYHSPVYPCRGGRCQIAVDNVGVYEPRPSR